MPYFKMRAAGKEVYVKSGTELLEVAKQHPALPLKFGCTRGQCGVCAIKVISGKENLTKQSFEELQTLAKKNCGSEWRLACQCALNGDVEIV